MSISSLLAIAAMTVVPLAHAGLVEKPGREDENPDRFVIHDGTLAISRPDPSWEIKIDASEPPTVAKMRSPDKAAFVDVQVQQVLGMTLASVKEPIEQAVAAQTEDFQKLSGRDIELNEAAAHEVSFTATWDGQLHRAKMLIVKPGDTLYLVKCSAPDGDWKRFESQCNAVLASFELLPEERRFVSTLGHDWGRRMYDLKTNRWSPLELEGDAITPGGSRRAAPTLASPDGFRQHPGRGFPGSGGTEAQAVTEWRCASASRGSSRCGSVLGSIRFETILGSPTCCGASASSGSSSGSSDSTQILRKPMEFLESGGSGGQQNGATFQECLKRHPDTRP